jgi:O-phosphoseryl-tRNA(Cys) synthetase
LGPAALNEIVVHNGNIYAVPRKDEGLTPSVHEAFTQGRRTGLTLIDLLIQGAVASLEEAVREGGTGFDERFKMIKGFAQVNVDIPENIREWMRGQHKAIQLGGPVFSGVKAKIVYN